MYESIIEDIKHYLTRPQINEFIRMDLHLLQESIIKAKSNLDRKSYQLVFIGPSHAGKTTVISSVLGMYFYDDSDNLTQVMHSDEGGRTTPCTIEIIPSDETRVDILPKSINELKGIISEYAHFITNKGGIIPEEVRSIINNWLTKELRDSLRKLNDVDNVIDIIAKELNLENLDTTILNLECNGNEKNEKFKAINRILGQIKKGKSERFIIPNKVEIYIERKYLNIPIEVSKIIDTRGISSETTKVGNSIVSREDLDNYINDDSSLVIYVNEFSSIERPVVDFFYDKLASPRTNPEDIVKFLVLINTRNGSIESKVGDEDVDEFLHDKKSEFKNAVLLSDEDESLKNLKIRENYKKINEIISQSSGEVAKFVFYQPLMGMKKETENSNNYFKVDDEQICADNREKICAEFHGVISLRNKIISDDLDSKVKIARMYISNELRLSSNTELGSMITNFEDGIKEKAQSMISEFFYKYFTDLISLTGRMDGRTVAAYVRGNGYVISRNETIVDDIYYWHKNMKRDLIEKLELVLESETKIFEEKSIVFKDYMTGVKALEVLQTTARNDVQKYVDYVSKELIEGLKNHLVGNGIFWSDVRIRYISTYASALNSVINRNFDSCYINTTKQKLISQKY